MRQGFGGPWTERKLQALEDYLKAFMRIMKHNPRAASFFTTTYLDGFAGSGARYATDESGQTKLEGFEGSDVVEFYRGSAQRALELEEPFDHYLFIEINKEWAKELEQLSAKFPQRSAQVITADANKFIPEWATQLAKNDRALVFLDPYGMQVEWSTIKALAGTQKVDLWVLVPLGQAIIRLLTQQAPPREWADALTRIFGTNEWREHFYSTSKTDTLFGEVETELREVDFAKITKFIVGRLRTVFADVLDEPVVLRNSTGIPLYVLCFAASNPRGADVAVRIATSIARKLNDGR